MPNITKTIRRRTIHPFAAVVLVATMALTAAPVAAAPADFEHSMDSLGAGPSALVAEARYDIDPNG